MSIIGKERNGKMKLLKTIIKIAALSLVVYFIVRSMIAAEALGISIKALLP